MHLERMKQTETLSWLTGSPQDPGPTPNLSVDQAGMQHAGRAMAAQLKILWVFPKKTGANSWPFYFPVPHSQLGCGMGRRLSICPRGAQGGPVCPRIPLCALSGGRRGA